MSTDSWSIFNMSFALLMLQAISIIRGCDMASSLQVAELHFCLSFGNQYYSCMRRGKLSSSRWDTLLSVLWFASSDDSDCIDLVGV